MLIISYDISDNKLRGKFAKMLTKNGAIRLQYSVYEVNNSKRFLDILCVKIEQLYSKHFTAEDSIVIFPVDLGKTIKFGNAIHRDQEMLFFD